MEDVERCPVCDRPHCDRFATMAWATPRDTVGLLMNSTAVRYVNECQEHAVDWRKRALDAEARIAFHTEADLLRWVLALAVACKINVHHFRDGSLGLVDVPVKYTAMIDALHCAAIAIIRGQPLPTIIPLPPPASRSKLRK